MQAAALVARQQAAGLVSQSTFVGEEGEGAALEGVVPGGEEDLEAVEKVYAADLAKELKAGGAGAKQGDVPELHGTDEGNDDDDDGDDSEGDDDEEEDAGEGGEGGRPAAAAAAAGGKRARGAEAEEAEDVSAFKDIMMSRKNRVLYQQLQKRDVAKKQRVEALEAKRSALGYKEAPRKQGRGGKQGQ